MGGQKRLKLSYTHSLKSLNDSNFSCGQVNLALTAEGKNIPPADTISDAQTAVNARLTWPQLKFESFNDLRLWVYLITAVNAIVTPRKGGLLRF